MTAKDTTSRQDKADIVRCKAVVFDLDDTLYPEQQYALSGFRAASDYIQRLFKIEVYEELVKRYLAGERSHIFTSALERHFKYVEDNFVHKVLNVFWSHSPRIEMFADARVCLALLISRGVRVGMITAGQSAIQRRKVAALELEPLLDAIIYSDELLGPRQPCQPCEDAFHILALQLDVALEDMVYVGDNPLTDFIVPRRLGVKTVRVRRRQGEHSLDEPPSPEFASDLTVASLQDLTIMPSGPAAAAHGE